MPVNKLLHQLEQCSEKMHTLKYRLFGHRLCMRKYLWAMDMEEIPRRK
jgi:hypothetical protein